MASVTLEAKLIERMNEIEDDYRALLEQRAANRRSLNDLIAQDLLSPEQVAAVRETYPERAPRGSGNGTAE